MKPLIIVALALLASPAFAQQQPKTTWHHDGFTCAATVGGMPDKPEISVIARRADGKEWDYNGPKGQTPILYCGPSNNRLAFEKTCGALPKELQ